MSDNLTAVQSAIKADNEKHAAAIAAGKTAAEKHAEWAAHYPVVVGALVAQIKAGQSRKSVLEEAIAAKPQGISSLNAAFGKAHVLAGTLLAADVKDGGMPANVVRNNVHGLKVVTKDKSGKVIKTEYGLGAVARYINTPTQSGAWTAKDKDGKIHKATCAAAAKAIGVKNPSGADRVGKIIELAETEGSEAAWKDVFLAMREIAKVKSEWIASVTGEKTRLERLLAMAGPAKKASETDSDGQHADEIEAIDALFAILRTMKSEAVEAQKEAAAA